MLKNLGAARVCKAVLVSAVAAAFNTSMALTQDQDAENEEDTVQLEEILITATKRSESLQDVGISVTAFTGELIERGNFLDSRELLLNIPNLDIGNGSSETTNANVFIRGVGSTGDAFNLQSGVGFYADEVVLNSPIVSVLQLYDMERVEALRGPQNTLYGRNTTGGAINYISRKPEVGGEANGFLQATYGRWNRIDVTGAVGAPLGEKAAIRAAFSTRNHDGFLRNTVTGENVGQRENYAGRLQIAYEPTETVNLLFKGHLERVRDQNRRNHVIDGFEIADLSTPCRNPLELGACAASNGFVPSSNKYEIASDLEQAPVHVDAGGASATANIDFETFSLTSITAYEENTYNMIADTDGTPNPRFHFAIDSSQDQFSQEIRLASTNDSALQWIVGAYYFDENTRGVTGPVIGSPMGVMLIKSLGEFNTTSMSAYGELEYEVTERVTLKAGGRISSDTIKGQATALLATDGFLGLDLTNVLRGQEFLPAFEVLEQAAIDAGINVFTGGTANPVGGGATRLVRVGGPTDPDALINDTTFDDWGAMLGVDFQATEDILFYGKWSRGFKAGRFNVAPMSIITLDNVDNRSVTDVPIRPETVNAYEIGAKTEFLDGRARFNIAAFYTDYQDQQLNQFLDGEFNVLNADSEIFGVDAELSLALGEEFYLDLSGGWLETKVLDSGTLQDVGDELPFAPDLMARAALRKDWTLSNGNVLSLDADARYVGNRWLGLANVVNGEPYTIVNTQLSYLFGSDNQYRLSLWGKNIFDELYFLDNNPNGTFLGANTARLGEPVSYGVTLMANF